MKKIFFCLLATMALVGCSIGFDGEYYREDGSSYSSAAEPGFSGGSNGNNGGGGQAGVLTAAEWCDLEHWDFWGYIMTIGPLNDETQNNPDYSQMALEWGFNTCHRVAVQVKDAEGNPVRNAVVQLLKGEDVLWTTKTSNTGNAELWKDLFSPKGQETGNDDLKIKIDGVLKDGSPEVSHFATNTKLNEYVANATKPEASADVAFIVDATGSMGDEIQFLKQDLLAILQQVESAAKGISLRTGAVFYRDRGDDYVTRVDNFNTPEKTSAFIRQQSAGGGGDLPEAVHTALEVALQNLSWNSTAQARMAFLILDAPAHINHEGVVESLKQSIKSFSEMGVRLVPVLCSTDDKSTEFMCRDFAIVTGGTYVFLTDDSGVGDSHVTPTVGDYQVEKLNELIYRLIEAYIQ